MSSELTPAEQPLASEVALGESLPHRYGDYELLHRIEQGGMGVVYRARQISLPRIVALKRIRADRLTTPQARERFRQEAEAIARLDHPNIVPIYEVGEQEGQIYFTMRLLQGESLARRRAEFSLRGEGPRKNRRRLLVGLLARVARAVDYAHRRGILHRDLKPSNLLLDAEGEPCVSDFGLAKPLGDVSPPERESGQFPMTGANSLTQTGFLIGTPLYMAPEQAAGQTNLTAGVDVWALGVILYELLTGQPPFHAADGNRLLQLIRDAPPELPQAVNPGINDDLQRICLKCLEKDPRKRYLAAGELADALDPPIGAVWERPQEGKRTASVQLSANDLAHAFFHEVGDALILLDPETERVLDANPMAEQLSGYTRVELQTMKATYLLRYVGQGGKESMQQAIGRSMANSWDGLLRTRQEGVWVPVKASVTRLHLPRQTVALITARDMREQVESSQRLERMEAELRRVLVAVASCRWCAEWNQDGRWTYRYLSPVVENLTGRPANFFAAEIARWQEVIHPDDRATWVQALRHMQGGQAIQIEYRVVWPDGSIRWLRESVRVAWKSGGQPLQLDGILTDFTRTKELETELDLARRTIADLLAVPAAIPVAAGSPSTPPLAQGNPVSDKDREASVERATNCGIRSSS